MKPHLSSLPPRPDALTRFFVGCPELRCLLLLLLSRVSFASATSAFSPTGGAPVCCRLAGNSSARYRNADRTRNLHKDGFKQWDPLEATMIKRLFSVVCYRTFPTSPLRGRYSRAPFSAHSPL